MDLDGLKKHRVKAVTSYVTFFHVKGFSADALEEKTEKTAERIFDEAGNLLSHQEWPLSEPPLKTSFDYDDNNRLIEKRIHTAGDPEQRYTFEYDEQGNLLAEYTHYEAGEPDVLRHEYENGKAIRMVAKDEDGEVESERKLTYDAAGRVLSDTKFDYGAEEEKTETTYDAQGRKMALKAFYGGELEAETEITYLDDTELVTEQIVTSSSNGEKTIRSYTYNEQHQIVEEQRSYEPSGQAARLHFTYDTRGLQTEVEEIHEATGRAPQTVRRTFTYEFHN